MKHASIPNMLGRVLAGSKYGVRQTRGKFGLGAKMALIWSKKSTGMPIEVKTAHSVSPDVIPLHISHCKLDIDIQKNEPNILVHEKRGNEEQRGCVRQGHHREGQKVGHVCKDHHQSPHKVQHRTACL